MIEYWNGWMTGMNSKFWRNVCEDSNGCWIWNGTIHPNGYPIYSNKRAHRITWVLRNGEIPPGEEIHHKCRHKTCVNPDHLELMEIPKHRAMSNGSKIACPRGHIYDQENTYIDCYGYRQCRECNRLRNSNGLPRQRRRRAGH